MAEKYCIINGEAVESDRAAVSPFDRGFMYGDGVFDTMYVLKGRPVLFDEHLERLSGDIRRLKIAQPFDSVGLKGMIAELIGLNGLSEDEAYVRTTVTRGVNQGGMFYESNAPTTVIIAGKVPDNINEIRQHGVRCMISKTTQKLTSNQIFSIKSLNFLWSIFGTEEALSHGFDECIFFNTDGFLAECSTSNVFTVKDKMVFTPPDDSGILPGITRGYIIKLLKKEGISVSKTNITEDGLLAADEVFLTSSIRGVVPVISIDGHGFGTAFTKDLQELYFNSL